MMQQRALNHSIERQNDSIACGIAQSSLPARHLDLPLPPIASHPPEASPHAPSTNGTMHGSAAAMHPAMTTTTQYDQLANVFRSASVGLAEIDTAGRFMLINDTFCKIVGRTREDLLTMTMQDVTHPDDLPASRLIMKKLLADGCAGNLEKRYIRPDGSIVECRASVSINLDGNGRPSIPLTLIAVLEDITERKQAEARINYLATHDNLTDLPNRRLLHAKLSHELHRSRRGKSSCALLALDLDRFKEVNDRCGHDIGDELLRQVASRLRNAVRAVDTISRVGGDEFIILQVQGVQPRAAARLAERVRKLITQPFHISGHQILIDCSIGIAQHRTDGDTETALLKAADIALYHTKSAGGGGYRFVEKKMHALARESRDLEQDLRLAMGTDQLKLHFQPQFTATDGTLVGFEALLRWQHPTRGSVPPLCFIPIAEMTGLILPLGLWAMEQACTEAMTWPQPVRVAVNLCSGQFRNKKLPSQIRAILKRTGLAPERLELELTESSLLKDNKDAVRMFRELKEIGLQIALDDFGTGYSSLGYLSHFHFDRIKIDKSFVEVLGREMSALPLVQAIIAMSRSLGIDVIAEGVETGLQLKILREQECEEIQGFFLGRPAPPQSLHQYFNQPRPQIEISGSQKPQAKPAKLKKQKSLNKIKPQESQRLVSVLS